MSWRWRQLLLLLVRRDGGSQRRCHILVDVTCRHDIDVAGPRTLPSGRIVRTTSLVTAHLSETQWTPCTTVRLIDSQSCCSNVIAARPRRTRAALSWEETHDAQFVRAVYGKDAQPGVQGNFTVRLLVPLFNVCLPWLFRND